MELPSNVGQMAAVVAWSLSQPGQQAKELARCFRLVSSDPSSVNRWVEALSRCQDYSTTHGESGLSIEEFTDIAAGCRTLPFRASC